MHFTNKQKIRFDDVDGAGIVYYPQFFHLCHKAFEDWFNENGPYSYPDLILKKRRGFPTVAIKADFILPLAYGDEASVQINVLKLGNSSAVLRYDILRFETKKICFSAQMTMVYLDLDKKKSVKIPSEFREFFSNYLIVE